MDENSIFLLNANNNLCNSLFCKLARRACLSVLETSLFDLS